MTAPPSTRRGAEVVDTGRDPLLPLAVGTLLLTAGGSLVFTLLAELQDRAGFSAWGLGLIAFAYFLTSFFAQFALARYADRGKTRQLLVGGAALSIIALVGFGFASSLLWLVLARGLGGIGFGCWEPAAKAAVLAGREADAGRRLGILTSASTGGIVVGPVLGVVLFEVTDSLMWPFVAFAAIQVISLTIGLSVRVAQSPRHGETVSGTPAEMLRRPPVRRALLVGIALLAPIGMYEVVWARLLTDLGAGPGFIGFSVAMYGLPFLIVAPFGGALGDRLGAERVAIAGAVGVSVIILLMGLTTSFVLLVVIGTFEAAINALAIPNAFAAMSRASSDTEQATGQGIVGGAGLASAGTLTLIAGVLYGIGGQTLVFSTTATITLLFALAAWTLTRQPATPAE